MTRKNVLVWAAVSIASVADAGTMAAGPVDDAVGNHRRRGRLRAELSSYNEVPSLSTSGRGSFFGRLSHDETKIEYRLDYAGLEGAVTVSHIHLGARHTTGGVIVWLCGPAGTAPAETPECGDPGGSGPEAEGTLSAASVVGPGGQGIAPGEFEELVKAIKAGATYVNVHSSSFPTGEIRGQIHLD
jgi:hypothetical protein